MTRNTTEVKNTMIYFETWHQWFTIHHVNEQIREELYTCFTYTALDVQEKMKLFCLAHDDDLLECSTKKIEEKTG